MLNILKQRYNIISIKKIVPYKIQFFSRLSDDAKIKKNYFPIENIRNFSIIAHIDHGKSTLADRFLEITGTIKKKLEKDQSQYLDKLQVERERGITVKAQTSAMYYFYKDKKYLLNLVDTPGHVDFNYEVSRSMRSCQGALLVVDATQGVQAQTLSNFDLAFGANLEIIPVVNKIDMPAAEIQLVTEQMKAQFDVKEEEIHYISAKTGLNAQKVLDDIIEKIPPPTGDINKQLKAFLIDSWYVKDQGVIKLFLILDGYITKGDIIQSAAFEKSFDVFEVGILNPEMIAQEALTAGQIGYVITNMKSAVDARIGDTFHIFGEKVEPVSGFKPAKPMVFAGIYPENPADYTELNKAIYKLQLEDPSVTIEKESSAALGNGFRCGFLGVLHMDVYKQRLDDEYEISIILTAPSVKYKCKLRNGETIEVENALNAPDPSLVKHYEEPICDVTIFTPQESVTQILNLCEMRRGEQVSLDALDPKKYIIKYKIPYAEIVTDFFDKIKSLTSGYGSLDFDVSGYKQSRVKKMVILLQSEPVDSLSFMVHEDKAYEFGKKICKKLKEHIPQQLFTIIIQAQFGGKVIAREEVSYLKRNFLAKCYGGDYTRKKKLIERHNAGKKFLRQVGRVTVDKETFMSVLKSE